MRKIWCIHAITLYTQFHVHRPLHPHLQQHLLLNAQIQNRIWCMPVITFISTIFKLSRVWYVAASPHKPVMTTSAPSPAIDTSSIQSFLIKFNGWLTLRLRSTRGLNRLRCDDQEARAITNISYRPRSSSWSRYPKMCNGDCDVPRHVSY